MTPTAIPSIDSPIVQTALLLASIGALLATAVLYALFLARYLRDRSRATDGANDDRLQPNGWWAILFLLPTGTVLYVLLWIVGTSLGVVFALPFEVIAAFVLALFGVHLLTPVAFHFDSRRVERHTGWRPSSVYYLSIVGVLGPLLAAHYLLKRYERTSGGTWSPAEEPTSEPDAPAESDGDQLPGWVRSVSRRDLFKLGAVAYAVYLGYLFVGRWVENQVKKLLFGSPPSFDFSPTGWQMPYFDPRRTSASPAADPPRGDLRLEPIRTDLGEFDEGIVAVADRTAYVLGEETVYAIDVDSGEIRWRYREENRHPSPFDDREWAVPYQVATDGDRVLVSINLGLTGVDAASGEHRWHYDVGSLFRDLGFAGNTAFINSHGVTAFDATIGVPRWGRSWSTGPDVPAAYSDGHVYTGHNVSTEEGNDEFVLLALDARTGDEVWRRRVDTGSKYSAANASVADGRVYYGGRTLVALDAETGSVAWERPNAVEGEHASKLVTDGRSLAVPSTAESVEAETSYLQVFDAATGSLRWSRELTTNFLDAVLAGEFLYVTLENELRVYELASGDLVSSLEHDAITGLNPPQVLEDLVVLKEHRGLYRIVRNDD